VEGSPCADGVGSSFGAPLACALVVAVSTFSLVAICGFSEWPQTERDWLDAEGSPFVDGVGSNSWVLGACVLCACVPVAGAGLDGRRQYPSSCFVELVVVNEAPDPFELAAWVLEWRWLRSAVGADAV